MNPVSHLIALTGLLTFGFNLTALASSEEHELSGDGGTLLLGTEKLYMDNCEACHGKQLQGTPQGPALVGGALKNGDAIAELSASISVGFPDKGMPAWAAVLDETEIQALAILVSEARQNLEIGNFKMDAAVQLPEGVIASERHAFTVASVVENLDPLPYDIAYYPGNQFLVTEKHIGLSIVSPDGVKTLIEGIPEPEPRKEDDPGFGGLDTSNGWTLGVALHPQYQANGWIYLSYGDICKACGQPTADNPLYPSMTRLIRGRVREGKWVDEELIWESAKAHYVATQDMTAGGRIAFDGQGHVFFTVGFKNWNDGVQELEFPWGKIHRVNDDGSVPEDNPHVGKPGAIESIWTVGHRNPQGLTFDAQTSQLWAAEHGPRGGDEVNRILGGRNYGWPYYSLGVNYEGTEVGAEYEDRPPIEDIEQPVVDFTPSPAIAEVAVYRGEKFPQWQGNLLVSSLKARNLYRVELEQGKVRHVETLLSDFARIRDIEISEEGDIDLLLEHPGGGSIVRLEPARAAQ